MQDQEFNMYNNSAQLFGSLLMRPTGLTGEGTMKLEKAELISKTFHITQIGLLLNLQIWLFMIIK